MKCLIYAISMVLMNIFFNLLPITPPTIPAETATIQTTTPTQITPQVPPVAQAAPGATVTAPVETPPAPPKEMQLPLAEPAADEKQKAEKEQAEKKDVIEQLGIDTVDIEEGGNWLLKRKALEDMVDKIELINRLFAEILQSRMDFKIKQNQLSNEYDVFVGEIGFDLGDADKLFSVLLQDMEKERAREGDLSPEERDFIQKVMEQQKELLALQENLKTLHELESKIDDVMMTVEDQITTAEKYQNQAWRNFQIIKKVLSDEKAEEFYYQTDALYKNMQEIAQYLKGNLFQYFNEQMQLMRDRMQTIKTAVNSLKGNGVDLQKEAQKLEQRDVQLEQKREKEEEQRALELAIKKAQEESGFWYRLKAFFKAIPQTIGSWFSSLFQGIMRMFGRTESPKPLPVTPVTPHTPETK